MTALYQTKFERQFEWLPQGLGGTSYRVRLDRGAEVVPATNLPQGGFWVKEPPAHLADNEYFMSAFRNVGLWVNDREVFDHSIHHQPLLTLEDAMAYVRALVEVSADWHWDDDPEEIHWDSPIRLRPCDFEAARERIAEARSMDWGEFGDIFGFTLNCHGHGVTEESIAGDLKVLLQGPDGPLHNGPGAAPVEPGWYWSEDFQTSQCWGPYESRAAAIAAHGAGNRKGDGYGGPWSVERGL